MARFRESTDRSETTMQLELERYVPGLLLWLSNKVSSSASLLYNEKFGVGVTEWRVLAYFNIYPWSTASKASELMGLDKGAVSRAIATLVGNGWLDSRPQGLRKIEYQVTGERRLDADLRRFVVTNFTHHYYVGVLPQKGAQRRGEVEADIIMHLRLIYAG